MFTLFKHFFTPPARQLARYEETTIRAAIEQVVAGTDPRLRLVGGYKRKLRHAVVCALDYLNDLMQALPAPLAVNRAAFSSDPRVHAFFASSEDLQNVFSLSKPLQKFLAQPENRALTKVYALLVMRRREKTQLGAELQGDIIRRDIRQTSVSFSNHVLITPAASSAALRQELLQRALRDLAACALEKILAVQSHKTELQKQKHLLQVQLQARTARSEGLEALLAESADGSDSMAGLQQRLAETEENLRAVVARQMTLDDYLELVGDVLNHPEDYLQVQRVTLRLNRLGVKVKAGATQAGDEIAFTEVSIGERFRGVIALVEYPRAELLPRSHYLAKAQAYTKL